MDKRTEFNDALKEALKAKEQVTVSTIRLILAALKDRDIVERSKGHAEGLGEDDILSMLQSMIKQRTESFKTYKDAGRDDLATREQEEIEVIKRFMPAQLSRDEISAAVDNIIGELGVSDIKEMGKVMTELKSRYAGQVDMGQASGVVKERLVG